MKNMQVLIFDVWTWKTGMVVRDCQSDFVSVSTRGFFPGKY